MRVARLQQLLLAAQIAGALLAALAVVHWTELGRGWAIAAALVTPLTAHAAVIATHFVTAGRARARLDPGAETWRAGETLRAFAGEMCASIRVFTLAQPLLSRYRIAAPPEVTGVPVLLIHGYFCNRGIWRSVAPALAAAGHPVAAIDLEPPFGPIDDYAPGIAGAVDALRSRTGARRVALVCHSMGGLAARAYARAHGSGAIAVLITLGSPHHGTWNARRGIGANARQMRFGSAWLQALARDEDRALAARTLSIYTEHDNIVSPQSSSRLAGARTLALRARGHVELVFDPRARRAVFGELARLSSEVNAPH